MWSGRRRPPRVFSSGGFSGSGFIKFKTRREAESAIVLLAGLDFNPDDKPLTAAIAKRDMEVGRRQTSAERAQLKPPGGVQAAHPGAQPRAGHGDASCYNDRADRADGRQAWAMPETRRTRRNDTVLQHEHPLRHCRSSRTGGQEDAAFNRCDSHASAAAADADAYDTRQRDDGDRAAYVYAHGRTTSSSDYSRRATGPAAPAAPAASTAEYDRRGPAETATGMYSDSYRPREAVRYVPRKHSPPLEAMPISREYSREAGARVSEPALVAAAYYDAYDAYDSGSGSGRHDPPREGRVGRDGREKRDALTARAGYPRGADVQPDFKRRRADAVGQARLPRAAGARDDYASGRDDYTSARPVLTPLTQTARNSGHVPHSRSRQGGSGSPGGAVDTLFVRGLLRETTNEHLAQIFRAFPGFTAVKITQNPPPKANYAFVKFEDAADAAVAKDSAHGFVACKEPYERLNVEVAKRSMQL